MTPDFALSFSYDGIDLLHRSAAGWRSLGSADPTSPRMAEELAVMRRTATAMAPGGLRCKLLIPNDQIRYLSIDTPGLDPDARREAARAALAGATPYRVDELVFDIHPDGARTHVAAVARETLAEAEAFAVEHRLHPVSFAARPEAGCPFAAEPFFGPTEAAAGLLAPGETVEREITAEEDTAPEEGPVPGFLSRRRARPAAPQARDREGVPGFAEEQAVFTKPERAHAAGPGPAAAKPAPQTLPAPAPVVRRPASEAERFTIYGAQTPRAPVAGRRYRGLAIAVSLVILAGLVAFAGGLSNGGVSGIIARLTAPAPEIQFNALPQPASPAPSAEESRALPDAAAPLDTALLPGDDAPAGVEARTEAAGDPVDVAALDPGLTDEDAAVLDALATEEPAEPDTVQSREAQRVDYEISGIWTVSPDVPSAPGLVDIDDLYVTSFDPINPNFDAVALPQVRTQEHELAFDAPIAPAPAGTRFVLDDRGMVVPSPQGSLDPDGILIFAGPPKARPPAALVKVEEPGEDLAVRLRLSAYRPKARPVDLIESSERAAFSGLTRSELSQFRPQLRPDSAQEEALAAAAEAPGGASLVPLGGTGTRALLEQPEQSGLDTASARAIVASLRPDARPRDFDRTVAKALEPAPAARNAAAAPAPAPTAVVPQTVAPRIPSSTSATREATLRNAINLRQVNLIGVYGTPSSRRALVRLGNGEYLKVAVGDRIDGGQVSAIGDSELRYQKSGRAVVLKMPRG